MHYEKSVEVNNSGVTVQHWRILGYDLNVEAGRGSVYVGGFASPMKSPLVQLRLAFHAPVVDVTMFGAVTLYGVLGELKHEGAPDGDTPPLAGGTVVFGDDAPARPALSENVA